MFWLTAQFGFTLPQNRIRKRKNKLIKIIVLQLVNLYEFLYISDCFVRYLVENENMMPPKYFG